MKHLGLSSIGPVLAAVAALAPACAWAQTASAPGQPAIPGVQVLYAHEGDNSIVAYATPDGYAQVRALVKHLDSDLDIIRTEACLVVVSPAALKTLGLDAAAPDAALLAAWGAGRLASSSRLRLTTREDTPIDALLRDPRGGSLPLLLVPREDADGTLSVELLQPAVQRLSSARSGTLLARLPSAPDGTLRLLFLTPTLLPSGARTGR